MDSQHIAEVIAATAAFSSNLTDPKASIITDFIFPGVSTSLPELRKARH